MDENELQAQNAKALALYEKEEYAEALSLWKQGLKDYNPESMFYVASCYNDGTGVACDKKMAFNLFLTCVRKNEGKMDWFIAQSMCNVGVAYLEGEGVEKNITLACEWLERAAENACVVAIARLAFSYSSEDSEIGVDYEKAYKYASMGAAIDDELSWYVLSMLLCQGLGCKEDFEKGMEALKKSAELGFEPAIKTLKEAGDAIGKDSAANDDGEKENYSDSEVYDHDTFCKKFKKLELLDTDKLADMPYVNPYNSEIILADKEYDENLDNFDYTKMTLNQILDEAAKGSRVALYIIGEAYFNAKEYEQSFQFHSKAAAHGYAPAQYKLAMLYIHGLGTRIDNAACIAYVAKAAKQNYVPALKLLAEYFIEHGDGEKMFEVYPKLADEFNDADACEKMGVFYYKGVGVDVDIPKAIHYFEKAIKNGAKGFVHLKLGEVYLMNQKDAEGLKKASECFLEAIKNGCKEGYYYMGVIFKAFGEKESAIEAFEEALKAGVEDARTFLDELKNK